MIKFHKDNRQGSMITAEYLNGKVSESLSAEILFKSRLEAWESIIKPQN